MKRTSQYTSCMHTAVRYHIFEPKVILRVKGVVFIHHGLSEHADRYDHFASFLANHGFVVVVSDFAGHGKSLIDFEQGYFGDEHGPENLVKDMHRLQMIVRRSYPDAPYFLLGVDLGSVLIRKYVLEYGDFVEGILLLGTMTHVSYTALKKAYLSLVKKWKGSTYRPQYYFQKFHQSNNKKIHSQKTCVDWLTSDESEKKKYLNDPMTHFVYTTQGYRDILNCISEVDCLEDIKRMPKDLSVYIAFGQGDPLSKNTHQLISKYKKCDIQDIYVKTFDNMRHYLLFEKNKMIVYQDILNWLNQRTYL